MASIGTSEAQNADDHYVPTLEVAKLMIKDFFEQHHGRVIDYVDLTKALDLPLPLIVDACNELEQAGKIAGVD
jgi:hypothetical protein